ncbi:MAG: (d)CMP kinase [Oscillospiraceae bacterium]|nr:(d)CMP kinase [Oscillospiraceae bacterium]
MEIRSIAIDGPSGAGKSTLSKMVAKEFGLIYVDTGAMYRTIGLFAQRNGVGSKDAVNVEKLLPQINIEMKYDETGTQRMVLNGEDVSDDIRLPQISIYASDVSAMPAVRAFLLEMQRSMAKTYDVIMDGRDIGTVVLPNAGLKIFLSADAEDRAARRFAELHERGVSATYKDVLKDINYRDENDSKRAAAPLKPADDSVIIDTTGNTLNDSFKLISDLVRKHLEKVNG